MSGDDDDDEDDSRAPGSTENTQKCVRTPSISPRRLSSAAAAVEKETKEKKKKKGLQECVPASGKFQSERIEFVV